MLNTMKQRFSAGFLTDLLHPAILVLLILVGYGVTLGHGFVSDDIQSILTDLPRYSWSQIVSDPYFLLRPTRILQFFVYQAVGLMPHWYRLVNIFFHTGSALLTYLIVRQVMGKRKAFLSACIVAIHPMMIESVTWISGGVYAQYGMLFLLSFWFFLRFQRKDGSHALPHFVASLVLYALALLFSEKAAALVLLYAAWLWHSGVRKKQFIYLMPFGIGSGLCILYYLSQLSGRIAGVSQVTGSLNSGLTNPFYQIPIAIASYIGLFFWPNQLSFYHDDTVLSFLNYIPSVVLMVFFTILFVWAGIKNRRMWFWLSWIIIPLLPTLTPFRVAWISAERYGYLSVIGLSVVSVIMVDSIQNRLHERFPGWKKRINTAMVVFWVCVVLGLGIRTILRNQDWKTADTLWIATAKTAPNIPYTWNNMGDVYARRGDFQQAARMFERAIKLNPRYADAYHNLGQTYEDMHQPGDAILLYKQALTIQSSLWQSHVALARLYARKGEYRSALTHIESALAFQPGNTELLQAKTQLEHLLTPTP